MQAFFSIFIATIVPLAVLDAAWLSLMGARFYGKRLSHLMDGSLTWWPIVMFYPVYAFAITAFVVAPALERGDTALPTFVMGALLGLAAYGAYDFTNHATLKRWPSVVTAVDLAWRMLMTGATAVAATTVIRWVA